MRRLLAIALPAVLLLGAPAAAPAKGIVSAKVCGTDGCRTIDRPDETLLGGGPPTSGPTRGEPFVRLDIRVGVPGHVERVRMLYAPGSELLLADDGATWMQPTGLAALRVQAERVKPFAASALPAAALASAAERPSADMPLPPEVFGATAAPAPAASDGGGGLEAWWLALAGAAIVLAVGVVLARRRRRGPPARAAGATG